MIRRKILQLTAITAFFAFPAAALCAPVEADDIRCTRDSLSIAQAKQRDTWAVNVQKQSRRRTTSGTFRNTTYDDLNEMLNYWCDEGEPSLCGRPIYPTFMIPVGTNGWDFNNSRWRAHPISDYNQKHPTNYIHAAFCTSSCFYPGMKILFDQGYEDIKFAYDLKNAGRDARLKKLIALDENSTLANPVYTEKDVAAYTTEISEENIDVYSLAMKNETVLKVTGNHVFLDGCGKITTAEQIYNAMEQGEEQTILNMKGQAEIVDSIQVETKFTKVYNIRPKADKLLNHILIVDGYLTGSSYMQNVELSEANEQLLFNSMTSREQVNALLDELEAEED